MRIVCQQTILMKYHALFVSFEKKNSKIWNCRLLQIIDGALGVYHQFKYLLWVFTKYGFVEK